RDAQKRETTFTSLRDLQQAIVKGQLSPQHQLSHGGQAFRPLEDIYELQTFFSAARQRPRDRPAPRTLLGVGRDGQPPARQSTPPPRKRASEPPQQERVTPVAGLPAMKAAAAPALEPASSGQVSGPRASFESGQRPAVKQRTPSPVPQSPVPPPYAPVERTASAHQTTSPPSSTAPLPWQNMQGLHADSEVDELAMRKGAGSRWIVAIVVLGALALVAGTVGRDYLLGFAAPKAAAPQADERVPALIEQARLALAKGDFESAHTELAKASVLGENDPRVASEQARLEVTRAELLWTLQRVNAALEAAKAEALEKAPPSRRKKSEADLSAEALAASKDASDKKALDQSFQDRLAKAKAAVGVALKLAPGAVDVVRSQVDLLRLDNQPSQARTLVSALSAQASDPDNAYSLGALDLAEGPAGYPAAIDRLRVAARPEEALGKARPLLIYALCKTDAAAAGAELDKLQAIAPTHRALPALRALVELQKSKLTPEPEVPRKAAAAPTPPPAAAAPASTEAPAKPAAPKPAGDPSKSALAKATELHDQGDLDGAETLYQQVLQRTPNSVPALSGLGDIARQRHQNATAAVYYDQILKQDRNHVPTLMARADMYWEGGNRILGVALYRRVLSQVGSNDTRGARALRRIEEFDRDVAAAESKDKPEEGTEGSAPPASDEGTPKEDEAPSKSNDSEPAPSGDTSETPPPKANRTPPAPSPEPPGGGSPGGSSPGSGSPGSGSTGKDEPAGDPAERP
ncbi:MAG TPA: tetratricopeptide repeat protein, partial [Polyangiaceae bacterium]|nr:tetratricopeptide repeat protein [Polyangiaceae bacterium]